jgi:AcrR family transcriptional regulator
LQLKGENGRSRSTLGRKGIETRARLLRATRELLETVSPFNLTVAAIAKAAKTVPGTLYVYFDDVSAVFYELSVEASEDFQAMVEAHADWFADPARIEADARAFITEFNRIWDKHSHVLHYRNMEADRGNSRFLVLRVAGSARIINRLTDAIVHARPELAKVQARAEAVVLYSAVERIAGSRVSFPADRPGPPEAELTEAQVRIIARQLGAG